jgi:hypothetical protein
MKQHQHAKPGPSAGATRSERRPTGPTDQPEVEGHGLPGALDLRVTPRNPEWGHTRQGRVAPIHGSPTSRHPKHEARSR